MLSPSHTHRTHTKHQLGNSDLRLRHYSTATPQVRSEFSPTLKLDDSRPNKLLNLSSFVLQQHIWLPVCKSSFTELSIALLKDIERV